MPDSSIHEFKIVCPKCDGTRQIDVYRGTHHTTRVCGCDRGWRTVLRRESEVPKEDQLCLTL